MIGVRIAIQTKCLGMPLRQALHTAGRLEAEGVQIDLREELPVGELSDTATRQLRKMLDDLNLRVGSCLFPTRRGFDNPEQLERRIEATIQAMHAASRIGARVMLVTMGQCPARETPARATLLESLAMVSASGNRVGVALALQTTASPAELEELLGELPEGALGLDANPAELVLSGVSPREFVERLGTRVTHLFANDAVRGFGSRGGGEVELGRGAADFPELLSILEEHGYRGWATIERRGSPQAIVDVENAVRFLRSL
jgi:sugar phosphate isomerase/epimerase